jgi:NhaP-type Na+/H+ or K+/H+ antiporter
MFVSAGHALGNEGLGWIVGLPLKMLVACVLGVAVFGGVGWAEAFVLAVILARTDAALGWPRRHRWEVCLRASGRA